MGVANDSITPAKHHELDAELGGREKVAKLSVAANHHRTTCHLCSWNQGQVAIEVERMSDRNIQLAQKTPQPPAASHRLQPIEAATEPELMQFAEALQKGSTFLHAAQVNLKMIRT
jgi:hypothetical protein